MPYPFPKKHKNPKKNMHKATSNGAGRTQKWLQSQHCCDLREPQHNEQYLQTSGLCKGFCFDFLIILKVNAINNDIDISDTTMEHVPLKYGWSDSNDHDWE